MDRQTATIRINTAYVDDRIGRQYARNLKQTLRSEFPDWDVKVVPGVADAIALPIEDTLEHFRTEFRVRGLMTDALMKAVDDCKNDRDMP